MYYHQLLTTRDDVGSLTMAGSILSQERTKQERTEIREGVKPSVEPYILVTELDAIANIGVLSEHFNIA